MTGRIESVTRESVLGIYGTVILISNDSAAGKFIAVLLSFPEPGNVGPCTGPRVGTADR